MTIVSTTRLDAAARRRQDAGLRRRPHRRHHRRRLLRERRVLEGARGDHQPQAAARPLRARRRLRAGDRADLRRADGRLHRADRTVARALRHRRRPRRLPSGAAGARGRLPGARRRRSREVREPRALSGRRRDRRRGHPDVARRAPASRRTPTSSSSRAATPTTSTRCARWRRAICATSASSAAAPRWRASTTSCSPSRCRPTLLKHVHAPIGLDIGAVTPQEIAVSILAELIAVKHGKAAADGGGRSMKWDPPKLAAKE